ncbi:MAG: hypothetical protein F2782_03110 [Actinobacteria bacterium]|uniref:Unannotated protein n=1 Tax=freshwater metagenome TaxID=449393 RepID=A0A6J7D641_9ZZZZ|nr:hypothetical protein [Actinomycetota bacterium]
MQIKSRIAGSAMALALALGMSAAPAFAASPVNPPVAVTGQTAFPQGTQVSRGICSGLLIGSLKASDGVNGLGTVNRDITSSSKGVQTSLGGTFGACLVQARIGVSAWTSPPGDLDTAFGLETITKSGTKLHSSATSCNSDANGNGIPREPAAFVTKQVPTGLSVANGGAVVTTTAAVGGDFQTDTRALNGKFSYAFADGTKSDAYIRVQGFDTSLATIIWLTGIVTKGEFVGSTVGGNVWFNPVAKDKAATGYFGSAVAGSLAGNTVAYAPGYAGGLGGAGGAAIGCLTGGDMTPGITAVAIGSGSTDPLLGATSDGVRFLL